jgi:hypothetical protein
MCLNLVDPLDSLITRFADQRVKGYPFGHTSNCKDIQNIDLGSWNRTKQLASPGWNCHCVTT